MVPYNEPKPASRVAEEVAGAEELPVSRNFLAPDCSRSHFALIWQCGWVSVSTCSGKWDAVDTMYDSVRMALGAAVPVF